jgi:hypothetical protein
MNRKILRRIGLVLVGIAIGAGLFAGLSAAQQYRPPTGYAFWSKADNTNKLVYLTGYSDAEQFYRAAIDTTIQPRCADDGKKAVADLEYKVPLPTQSTLFQEEQGIDEFYKDFRNQSIDLFYVQNIVHMEILGRPQAEIDAAIARARQN